MPKEPDEAVSVRLQASVYLCGTFSNSMSNLMAVILPLWLISLDPTPFMIGLVIGSRTFLPLLLSIHGGSMIDKIGARRIILCSGLILSAVTFLYPTTIWLPLIILFQMIAGHAATLGWIGAQTLIGQRMRGDPTYAGRMAFSNRIGILVGPPLAGATWDIAGPVAAFCFTAAWALFIVVGVMLLPKSSKEIEFPQTKFQWSSIIPHPRDYIAAFGLLAIPAVLLVVLVSVLRVVGEAVSASFYVVYLDSIGLSGTAIGLLQSAYSAFGAASALSSGRLARTFNPFWLLIGAVASGTILICITPLLGGYYFVLMAAMMSRGAVTGLVQPLMLSIVSRATDSASQGLAVGLRATSNRLAMTFTPILMGGVVEILGLATAFYVIGFVTLTLLLGVAFYLKSTPDFNSTHR